MKKPKILILTSVFPFLPGEYFFEDEMPYWEATELFEEIIIMPWSAKGDPRPVSKNIRIDKTLSEKAASKWIRYFYCAQSFLCSFTYKEILYLVKAKKLTARNMYRMLACVSGAMLTYKMLRKFCREKNRYVVYTYWNTAQAYGAALAKKAGLIDQLISRAHGGDVYEQRHPGNYMPLKRQFAQYFDSIFALSGEAKDYMQNTYRIPSHILKIAPLGVPLPAGISSPGGSGEVNIVSVSFCRPIKRVDKIIEAIALFTERNPSLRVNWRHIGGGSLVEEMKELASFRLSSHGNLTYAFLGTIPNGEVKAFYLWNSIDVFINASESEGIPVSIMEAMAAGVLPVAPNVGGMSDLVSNDFGVLMSENPPIEEIAAAIGLAAQKARRADLRAKARERIQSRFTAAKNYPEFIKLLHGIATDFYHPK